MDWPGVRADSTGPKNTLEEKVSSDAASLSKMISEQGFAFDELVEDQPRARGAKRVQWASIATHRRCRMDWCWATPSSKPLTVVWRHAGRPIFVRKLGNTSAADVLRREHDHGQRVWWESNATHPRHSIDAVPPSSGRSSGDSCSREGNVMLPTLSQAATRFVTNADAAVEVWAKEPRAPSEPVLGKGTATGEATTAESLSAGVQPWAMETRVLKGGV